MASRTNTLFSIPMLFFMGSASHLVWFDTGTNPLLYWILAGVVMAAVELNALIGPGAPTQKMLTSVKGTIHAGFGLTLVLFLIGLWVNT